MYFRLRETTRYYIFGFTNVLSFVLYWTTYVIVLQLQNKIDEKKIKNRKSSAGPSKLLQKNKASKSVSNIISSPSQRSSNSIKQSEMIMKEGSDVERDMTRVACIPPDFIKLPTESPVQQVSCGLHHTILLMQNGQVCTYF